MQLTLRKNLSIHCLTLLGTVLLLSCSEVREPLPSNLKPEVSAHPAGFLNKNLADFHGIFIRTIGWDLGNCQQCHGQNYSGGIAESSCLNCHTNTPEDCVVCHGGVENLTGAPPSDLDDNLEEDTRGVGAHTAHLRGGTFRIGIECRECHVVPDTYNAPGHVDSDLPAEVTFGSFARLDGALPNWDETSLSCANSYCHGNWSLSKQDSRFPNVYIADNLSGNAATPIWTEPNSVVCGSCHDLPPKGHAVYELSQCTICHSAVVNSSGQIVNKSKHINGNVNVFLQEYPVF